MDQNTSLYYKSGEKYHNFMKTILNRCRYSECFHKDKDCSDKIIKAHSIQHNRILNKLSENGDVLTFSFDISKPINELEKAVESIDFKMDKIGKKVASTFRGFCQYHDNFLFRPIEETDYKLGNREQEFLFAYRALAKGYSDIRSTISSNKELIKMVDDRSIDELYKTIYHGDIPEELYKYLKEYFISQVDGDLLVLNILDGLKVSFNKNLNKRNFTKVCTDTIVLPEEFHIAVSSMIYLGKDTRGEIINNFDQEGVKYKPLFITIFPQNNNTFVLLSYLKKDRKSFKFIKEDLMKKTIDEVKVVLTNIICNKIDNFYYSPLFWERLNLENKQVFLNQFTSSNISTKNDLDNINNINIFAT